MVANINAINFRISSDVSGLSAGVKLTRTEINRLNAIQRQAVSDSDKFVSQVNTMTKGLSAGAISAEAFAKAIEASQRKLLPTATEAQRLEQSLLIVNSALKSGAIDAKTALSASEALRQKYSQSAVDAKKLAEAQRQAAEETRQQAEAAARRSRVSSLVSREIGDATKLAIQIRELRKEYQAGNVSASQFARANQTLRQRYSEAKAVAASLTEEGKRLALQSQESAARLARVTSVVSKQVPETTRLAIQIRELRKEYDAGNVSASMFARANEALRQKYAAARESARSAAGQTDAYKRAQDQAAESARRLKDQMRQQVDAARQQSQSNAMVIGSLKSMAMAYIGLEAGRGVLESLIQTEDTQALFNAMTGSAENGKKLFQEVRTLSANSPLTFGDASKSAQTLLSFGIEANRVIPFMRQLGDIAGGNSERFGQLSLVFAQVAANGKLMGQDLLQFVNAGFNPLQQITELTGESMEDLRKRMSDGKISFDEVANAMRVATSEGGRFFGVMEERSRTAGGAIDLMRSDIEMLKSTVGSLVSEDVQAFSSAIRTVVSGVRSLIESTSTEFGLFLRIVSGPLGAMSTMLRTVGSRFAELGAYIKGVAKDVWSLAVGALTLDKSRLMSGLNADNIVAELQKLKQAATEAAEATKTATETSGATGVGGQSMPQLIVETTNATQDYIDRLREQNLELSMGADWVREYKAIQGITPEQQKELDFLKARNQELLAAKKNAEDAAEAQRKAADKRKGEVDALREAGAKFAESLKTPLEELTHRLTEINVAQQRGELTSREADLAKRAAESQFKGEGKPIKVELPPVARRGSREEANMIAQIFSNNRNRDEQHRRQQIDIMRAQLEAQNRTADAIANMPAVGAV